MAADGSLRFDTKIDTSDFDASISTLEKALDRFSKTVDKLSDHIAKGFGSAGNSAKEASEDIDRVRDSAAESSQKIDSIGGSAKKAEDRVKSLEEQMMAINIHDWQDMEVNMASGSPVSESVNTSSMNYDPKAMAAVFGDAAAEIYNYASAVELFGSQAGSEMNGLEKSAEAAGKEVEASAQKMERSYTGLKDSVVIGLGIVRDAFKKLPGVVMQSVKQIPGIVKNAFSKASRSLYGFAKSLGSGISSGAKRAVSGLRSLIKPADKASKSILKLSNMFKLMLIRMAMRAVIDGVKEGMQNLVRYSNDANHAMSSLMNGMTYSKNSFAAAFAPILSYVAPALNTLINLLATAIGYINQFFSALGGSSTFIKAKKVNEDYAKSLKATGGAASKAGKDAKKALAPFDELTTLQDQASGSGSGGGSGSVDPSEMFETVVINDAVSSFADQIRKAFEASDWKELGTLIGNKFNETIDGIDWSGAGHKMGYAINGAVQTAYYALTEADFVNLGAHVAELLNSGLSEIDFTFIGRLLVRGFTVGLDFLIGLLGGLNWGLVGKSVGDLLRGSFDEYYDWITDIDWSKMAHDLYSNIKQFLLGVDFASLAESFFRALGAALGGAVSFVASFVGDIWNDITGYFSDYITNDDGTRRCGMDWVAGVLQGILDAVVGVVVWIADHVAMPIINGFKEAFGIHSPSTVMAELGGYLIEGLIDGIKNFLPNLLNTLTEMAGEMKQKLSEILTYISGAFKDGWKRAWDGVKDVFKGVFNGILSILESALNFIVNGINKLSFDIPDWIPGIGRAKFGFDIQPFHLPRLASGTVVPPRAGEFAAILGDNNREAEVVSPISAMKQAFKEAISEMGTGNGDIHLTVNLDGKVIFNDIIKRNQMAKRQTGKNPLLV